MSFVYAVYYKRYLNKKFEWVFRCFDVESEAFEFCRSMRDLGVEVEKPIYTDDPWHLV